MSQRYNPSAEIRLRMAENIQVRPAPHSINSVQTSRSDLYTSTKTANQQEFASVIDSPAKIKSPTGYNHAHLLTSIPERGGRPPHSERRSSSSSLQTLPQVHHQPMTMAVNINSNNSIHQTPPSHSPTSSQATSQQSPILSSPLSAWGSIWSGTRSEDDGATPASLPGATPSSEPWRHSAFPVSWEERRLSVDQTVPTSPAVNRVPPAYRTQQSQSHSQAQSQAQSLHPGSPSSLHAPASPPPPLASSHPHSHNTHRYNQIIQPSASSVRHRFAYLAEATREAEVLSHMRGMSLGSANNGSNPGSPASVAAIIPNSPARMSAVSPGPGPTVFETSPINGPANHSVMSAGNTPGTSGLLSNTHKSSRSSSFSSVWDEPINTTSSSAWNTGVTRSPLTTPVKANKFKFGPQPSTDEQVPSIMSPKGVGPIQMNTAPQSNQYQSPTYGQTQGQAHSQPQQFSSSPIAVSPVAQHQQQPMSLNGPPPTFYPFNYAAAAAKGANVGSPVISSIPEQALLSSGHSQAPLGGSGPSSATPAKATNPALVSTPSSNASANLNNRSNRRNSGNGSISRSVPRSALLEEFRNNKTNKKYELGDLLGHAFEFSSDQHGSRFIQQKFESSTTEEMSAFFAEIAPESLQLMTDVFGNYVIQKFFELGTNEQRATLATNMKGHILTLSIQMYGCRVVQKAIEFVAPDMRIQLIKELDGHVVRCIKDQNGNHVIQKAIECIPSDQIEFVFRSFDNQVYSLAVHPYGCRVIQRMLEYCDDRQQAELLAQLHEFTKSLVEDQYGNYVVQHVIQKGAPADRAKAIQVIRGSIVTFSRHKFASNVVEKSILCGNAQQRRDITDEILAPRPDGTVPISLMIKDQYANYVIQKLLDVTTGQDHDRLVNAIRPHLQSLKKYAYGKHLVSIEKLLSCTVPKK